LLVCPITWTKRKSEDKEVYITQFTWIHLQGQRVGQRGVENKSGEQSAQNSSTLPTDD
jgi:hypothetical protein